MRQILERIKSDGYDIISVEVFYSWTLPGMWDINGLVTDATDDYRASGSGNFEGELTLTYHKLSELLSVL